MAKMLWRMTQPCVAQSQHDNNNNLILASRPPGVVLIRSHESSRRAQFGLAFPLLSGLQPVIDSSLVKHPADRRVSVDPITQGSGREVFVSISVRASSGTSQSLRFVGWFGLMRNLHRTRRGDVNALHVAHGDHRPLSRRSRSGTVISRLDAIYRAPRTRKTRIMD